MRINERAEPPQSVNLELTKMERANLNTALIDFLRRSSTIGEEQTSERRANRLSDLLHPNEYSKQEILNLSCDELELMHDALIGLAERVRPRDDAVYLEFMASELMGKVREFGAANIVNGVAIPDTAHELLARWEF